MTSSLSQKLICRVFCIWTIGGKRLFSIMSHREGAEPCADASPQGFKSKLLINHGLAVEKNVCGARVRAGHAPARCAIIVVVCRQWTKCRQPGKLCFIEFFCKKPLTYESNFRIFYIELVTRWSVRHHVIHTSVNQAASRVSSPPFPGGLFFNYCILSRIIAFVDEHGHN